MATRKSVLEAIKTHGQYSAQIEFNGSNKNPRLKGFNAVQPAERLEKQGLLKLKSKTVSNCGLITYYTWVKNDD